MGAKKVYDQVNRKSGNVFYSSSQGKELRDTWQIHQQCANLKKEKEENESHSHLQGKFESIINFQRGEKEFVKNVTCIPNSFYVLLATVVQLNNIAKYLLRDEWSAVNWHKF